MSDDLWFEWASLTMGSWYAEMMRALGLSHKAPNGTTLQWHLDRMAR